MSKNLKRNRQQIFRVDDAELALIKEKMEAARILNKEAYFRKMVLDGYILRLDFSDIRRMNFLLSNAANNLNQIAKRLNQGGSVHASAINQLRADYDELWSFSREVMTKLATL